LFENEVVEENDRMNYQLRELEGKKYLELISAKEPLSTENDALDLIALCWEHEANAIMMHSGALSDDFFKLKTKVAGSMIQKFINYGIKAAAIVPHEAIQKGRFKEMAMETNKGNHFRLYESKEEAEKWLLE
jgi:PadR family transcriptional regulator AphA